MVENNNNSEVNIPNIKENSAKDECTTVVKAYIPPDRPENYSLQRSNTCIIIDIIIKIIIFMVRKRCQTVIVV